MDGYPTNGAKRVIFLSQETKRSPFPCDACGKCCQRVGDSELTAWLDRGDSVCRNFDEATRLCRIYESRPLVCRVESFYEKYLQDRFSWDEFSKMNSDICRSFRDG